MNIPTKRKKAVVLIIGDNIANIKVIARHLSDLCAKTLSDLVSLKLQLVTRAQARTALRRRFSASLSARVPKSIIIRTYTRTFCSGPKSERGADLGASLSANASLSGHLCWI